MEDLGKIPQIKTTLERAIFLFGFIYNHIGTLNIIRQFTSKKELVRYRVSSFATTFLTLQRVHKQKHNFRNMFTSKHWVKSKWTRDAKGKMAAGIVLRVNAGDVPKTSKTDAEDIK